MRTTLAINGINEIFFAAFLQSSSYSRYFYLLICTETPIGFYVIKYVSLINLPAQPPQLQRCLTGVIRTLPNIYDGAFLQE